ncbi:MAG: nucleoside triphosphate pyrophosphohydrolase [Oscillospiraceae bacterium]|nr:nucleoside triphosphate pyrophosphohydrolase [Oscillospiraceae bacterium]
MFEQKQNYNINDLIAIMALLRSPEGCPWDIEQTHASIRSNVIEEAYEVAEAIDRRASGGKSEGSEQLCEELGDLLLQVIFHAQMASEAGEFDFNGVCDVICKKLVYRHPHVFSVGDDAHIVPLNSVNTPEQVLRNWDDLKSSSKGEETAADRLESVPKLLPALTRGEKVGKRAAHTGFDFNNTEEVLRTLKSEVMELETAILHKKDVEIEEEFGDVLFTCCNLGRFLKKDCEKALTISINKFIMRFRELESMVTSSGKSIEELDATELEELWQKAKNAEKSADRLTE